MTWGELKLNIALHRKRVLLNFAALGSMAATIFLFLPSSSPVWYLSALLAILANVGFGASVVAMNAYIPALAQESPEVVRILDNLQTFEREPSTADLEDQIMDIDSASAPLLSGDGSVAQESEETTKKLKLVLEAEYQTEFSQATSWISSFGIALGYVAGICLLIVALIPVTRLQGSTFSLRLAIGLSGIWWAVFTIPAAIWLPGSGAYRRGVQHLTPDSIHDVPGRAVNHVEVDKDWNFWKEIIAAWVRLGNMLRWTEIKKLGNTFKYLAAWFLLSDGPYQSIKYLFFYFSCYNNKMHRFHNHLFNCNPFWKNHATHVAFSSHSCGSSHSYIWDSRITRLALLTTSFRMDESSSPRIDSNFGVYDPCLRMLGFLLSGTNEVWRVDYTRGDVWFGGLFRLVDFYYISSFQRVYDYNRF